MQLRYILTVLIVILIPYFSFAQESRQERREKKKERINEMMRQQEEGVITLPKSTVFGIKLTSDGYGMFFELGRASSVKKAMLYQIEITERKSPKETKVGSAIPYGTSLIYGKENFFYPVKIGAQQQLLLGNKSNKNGVSVTANYGGGLIAGLLRPYYAQVSDGMGGLKYIKYQGDDKSEFLDYSVLVAGPPLSKGWSEISVTPGAYTKAGLRFDYGRFNEIVGAVEVGLTAEIYSKKIPQMVLVKEKQFFFGGYVAILFGKRK
jgi:hypothetical protein